MKVFIIIGVVILVFAFSQQIIRRYKNENEICRKNKLRFY